MQPTFFINHGGGPCFFLEPGPMRAAWQTLETYLRNVMGTLAEPPRAILAVSGHWEETLPTVNAGARPPLLFDYGGFPEHTYRLTWPAPGAPDLAARVRGLLSAAGIASGAERARGGITASSSRSRSWCRTHISRWCSSRCNAASIRHGTWRSGARCVLSATRAC